MTTAPARRIRPLVSAILAICLMAVGAALAVGAGKVFPELSPFGVRTQDRNTQILNAITREEQVVLLSLSIQGILERKSSTEFLGMNIPGSERASFLMYSFDAKLGLEGRDVRVEQSGDKVVRITLPKFIFIGHSNERFKMAAESNGLLSWATPEIDIAEMITNILNDDTQSNYLESNKELLRDQATAFYSGLIKSVDPTITVQFELGE